MWKRVLIVVFVMVVIIVMITLFNNKTIEEFELTKVKYKGNKYNVVDFENDNDSMMSAKTLEEILSRVNKLIDILNSMNFNNKRNKHWTPKNITENLAESGQTSYSVNKGEEIALCLRDKTNKLHDINTLMFVAIHELAHNYNNEIGHTDKFWRLMKEIIKIADTHGLYKPINYNLYPTDYCGITINSTP